MEISRMTTNEDVDVVASWNAGVLVEAIHFEVNCTVIHSSTSWSHGRTVPKFNLMQTTKCRESDIVFNDQGSIYAVCF